jgi:hypothetical protein
MITYLWILTNHKCYGALFAKQSELVFLICANNLLYENALSNMVRLIGSLP